jgi:hypothetical protein
MGTRIIIPEILWHTQDFSISLLIQGTTYSQMFWTECNSPTLAVGITAVFNNFDIMYSVIDCMQAVRSHFVAPSHVRH